MVDEAWRDHYERMRYDVVLYKLVGNRTNVYFLDAVELLRQKGGFGSKDV